LMLGIRLERLWLRLFGVVGWRAKIPSAVNPDLGGQSESEPG